MQRGKNKFLCTYVSMYAFKFNCHKYLFHDVIVNDVTVSYAFADTADTREYVDAKKQNIRNTQTAIHRRDTALLRRVSTVTWLHIACQ